MAIVEIIEKSTERGFVYQVLRITFESGESVDLFIDSKEMNKVLLAMIKQKGK